MHPAFSVVFFTTATGAGYGLLALLGVLGGFQIIPPDFWLGFVGMGLALCLIAAGLLSSTGHLGRPERAWRAFSQWRSSWLSREGVASVATFVPAGLFGIGWVLLGRERPQRDLFDAQHARHADHAAIEDRKDEERTRQLYL